MNISEPMVSQPENYSRTLLPHQLTSIYMMEKMEKEQRICEGSIEIENRVGIQGDRTGYGKTCSMIGLIVRDKMKWDMEEKFVEKFKHFATGLLTVNRVRIRRKIRASLIVASQSIISQWKNELERTELNYTVIKTRKAIEMLNIGDMDVILVTPTMYNNLLAKYSNLAWKRLVYDEPGTCHIPSMKHITSGFVWFVTATPIVMKQKYFGKTTHFISSLGLSYLENPFFNLLLVKNSEDYVKQSWKMPPVSHTYYYCHQPLARTMRGLVSGVVETMIAAGNVRGAVISMGGTETDSIIDLVRSRIQEDVEEARQKISRYSNRNNNRLKEQWVERLNALQRKLDTLEERFQRVLEDSCTICLSPMDEPVMVSCCQNMFCGKCIFEWMKANSPSPKCPMCRQVIKPNELAYFKNDSRPHSPAPKIDRPLTKEEQVEQIILENPFSKVIIFSEEDATYNLINAKMRDSKIKVEEIKGRTEARDRVIRNFKNGESRAIFLNSRNNGAGIDLQECTDIVLYHSMSTDLQTQILGRANRIGRCIPLRVHHLRVKH